MQRALQVTSASLTPLKKTRILPILASSAVYSFSKTAKTAEARPGLQAGLLKGNALMTHLRETLPNAYTKTLLTTYFNPNSADQVYPGSVLSVTYDGGSFAGVLISVRHKGVDTSFTLRNVILRTGVEMRFTVGSPMIKEVRVLSRAGGKASGDRKRMRRAKLFYLRDQPAKMSAISADVKKAS